MKSKRRAFLGGNTRLRLVLTLGLAVVLPALALIYVSFQHVKSIKRDKKIEALIHRDFQYLLYAGVKKMNGEAYAKTEEARDLFPSESDSEEEKLRKLKLILENRPWFDHVFLFDYGCHCFSFLLTHTFRQRNCPPSLRGAQVPFLNCSI